MTCPIVLAGPPGAGKSTVAEHVARRLGVVALDLDQEIERRTRRRVGDIIREDGEAKFRMVEAETLSAIEGAGVIALGGGTLTSPAGRRAARKKGLLIGLDAPADTLFERLEREGGDRPLLASTSPREALDGLLRARRVSYRAVDRRVSAVGAPDRIAAEVTDLAERTDLAFAKVGAKESRIVIGRALSTAAPIAALDPKRPVLVVLDQGAPERLRRAALDDVGASYTIHAEELPGGETVKRFEVLERVLDSAVKSGCGRQSVVVGIGGGATCDLAAMVAALLGRGAPLVLVPTTLLAQVDASVGGKCAVNLASGRNLAGTFHPADDVLIDPDYLESLSPEETRSGLAEALKMGIIGDAELFRDLAKDGRITAKRIGRAIELKSQIVESDPYEAGVRKVLNLGHTLGHALEAASNFEIRHGEAVAIGMAAVVRLGAERGWTPDAVRDEILAGIAGLGLPTSAEPALLAACTGWLDRDKKAERTEIDLVVVRALGSVHWNRVSLESIGPELVRHAMRTAEQPSAQNSER